MKYDQVHTIRDFYDGARSGTADLEGVPHYFLCPFDDSPYGYADDFLLHPVSAEFMQRELQHWAIYRAWETRFHNGLEPERTHPGHGGVDPTYDELGDWLDAQIASLAPIPTRYRARFRAIHGQDDLARGVLRGLEVHWLPTIA